MVSMSISMMSWPCVMGSRVAMLFSSRGGATFCDEEEIQKLGLADEGKGGMADEVRLRPGWMVQARRGQEDESELSEHGMQ